MKKKQMLVDTFLREFPKQVIDDTGSRKTKVHSLRGKWLPRCVPGNCALGKINPVNVIEVSSVMLEKARNWRECVGGEPIRSNGVTWVYLLLLLVHNVFLKLKKRAVGLLQFQPTETGLLHRTKGSSKAA
jgi:hypothetical protein